MNPFFDNIQKLTSSAQKIKLGKGLVSKVTTFLIVTVIVLGSIAFKYDDPYLSAGGFVLIIFFSIFGLNKIFKLAHEKPEAALLEGMELVLYQQVIQLSSKELPSPPINQQILPDPQTPLLEGVSQGDHDEEEVE